MIRTISWCMFAQIIFSGASMCVVIIFILFYLDDLFSYVYYAIYLFAIPMEIFPTCYYGSKFQLEFYKLSYDLFSCNWIDQSKEFKLNLRIFIQQSLKDVKALAGGMFNINLDAFFACCKMAYSLFAVITRVK